MASMTEPSVPPHPPPSLNNSHTNTLPQPSFPVSSGMTSHNAQSQLSFTHQLAPPISTNYAATGVTDPGLVHAPKLEGGARKDEAGLAGSIPRLSPTPSLGSSSVSSQHPPPSHSSQASSVPTPAQSASYLPASLTFLPPPRANANPDEPPFVQPSYFYPSPYTIDVDEFDGYRISNVTPVQTKKERLAREESVASSVTAGGVDGVAAAGVTEGGAEEGAADDGDDDEIRKAKIQGKAARTWLSPEDDEDCKRGIPVFEPTMEEFADFEDYMTRVDHWGRRAGIVKVIPPKEWIDSLPDIHPEQLQAIKIKSPIQQNMMGIGGLFRQNNIEKEKKKPLSVEEWLKKCTDAKWAMPSLKETDRSERPIGTRTKKRKAGDGSAAGKEVTPVAESRSVEEEETLLNGGETTGQKEGAGSDGQPSQEPNPSPSKNATASSSKAPPAPQPLNPLYNSLISTHPWLPPKTTPADFTPEACRTLERKFWRQLGMGEPAWYGADLQGTLFTPETEAWNVGKLPNLLNRLRLKKQLPGVNTPYLYWGMWRSHFCWHVEDMDLYSVNYLHFGAPKFWYAIPQSKADNFERVMKGYFPNDVHTCSQFLRHKSFAASPAKLALDSLRPNVLVQHKNEFVFTFPRGYHSGFNMGFNCAESINFAIDSWVELGRRAKVCQCVGDSVKIDVDAVIAEHELLTEIDRQKALRGSSTADGKKFRGPGKKRASDAMDPDSNSTLSFKKTKLTPEEKLAKKEQEKKSKKDAEKGRLEEMPCVLCPSPEEWDLMEVLEVPAILKNAKKDGPGKVWFAHERCANNVPETYFVDVQVTNASGQTEEVRKIAGVQNIVRERWLLNCAVCVKPATKKMGGKIQCTKGKCSRSFHVTCALSSPDVVLREFETEEWVEEGPTAERPYPHKVLKASINTECLCPTHNPDVKERKKVLVAEKRKEDIMALKPNELVKIKTKQGMVYEVPLVRTNEREETISVLWDSTELKVPFAHVILPESTGKSVGSTSTQPSAAYRPGPFFSQTQQSSSSRAPSSAAYPSLPAGAVGPGSTFFQNIRQTSNPSFQQRPMPSSSHSSSSGPSYGSAFDARQTPSIAFPSRPSTFSAAYSSMASRPSFSSQYQQQQQQRPQHPPSYQNQNQNTLHYPQQQEMRYLPPPHQQSRPQHPPHHQNPHLYTNFSQQPYTPPTFMYPMTIPSNMAAASFAPPPVMLPQDMRLSPAMLELIGKNSVIGSAFANLGWSPAVPAGGVGHAQGK